jgi:hypothetical protein
VLWRMNVLKTQHDLATEFFAALFLALIL